MKRLLQLAIAVGLAITSSTYAQFQQDPNVNPNGVTDDQGSPDDQARAVARISIINGDVSVRRGDSDEVVAAALNAPIVGQDRVMTNEGSRAEIQFDSSNMIRLAPMSEIRLADLEYNRYQIQIARGTVTFRVLRDQTADVELSTPTVSVRPVNRGVYRISVRDDGTTEITVRVGEADIFTPRGSERLSAGRTMLARGTPADPEVQVVGALRLDEWDQWNDRRDKDLERSQSRQYVSGDIYGTEDLDANGRWVDDAEYGNVWAPYATGGWAPYRNGRWVWMDYYGWSWVSYDSWGWAPYHYGRWFYRASFGWCWYPGERHSRHYWSPALVAFFGFGGGGGVNVGFGNVGWIPLGPREPYYRGYGRGVYGGYRNGRNTDRSINIVNNVNLTNVYRNARVNNGITAIDHGNFGRGRVGNNVRVSPDDLNRATLVRGQLPVAPGRESLRMSDRDARVIRGGSDTTRFASRRGTPQVDRVPFEEQRRGMEQISRRTLGDIPVQAGRGSTPAVTSNPGSNNNSGGWRRFGEPVRGGEVDRSPVSRPVETYRRDPIFSGRGQSDVPTTRGGADNQRNNQRQESRGYQPRQEVAPRAPEPRYQPAPVESPRIEPSRQRNFDGGGNRGESIRISPQIVRERAPERTVERSMPRQEPRQNLERSAPRQEQRAEPRSEPRGNSGGGENRGGGNNADHGGGRGGRGR